MATSKIGILQKRIKSTRTHLNKTLLQIANEIGVKEATMQRYESGAIKNIKYETIEALANALNTTPQYLVGWDDDMKPQNHQDEIIYLNDVESQVIKKLRAMSSIEQRIALRTFEIDYRGTDIIQFNTSPPTSRVAERPNPYYNKNK
jgi:transcriptional regulator with XRE-family HTH domain